MYMADPATQQRHAQLRQPLLMVAQVLSEAAQRAKDEDWVTYATRRLEEDGMTVDHESDSEAGPEAPREKLHALTGFAAKAERLVAASQVRWS